MFIKILSVCILLLVVTADDSHNPKQPIRACPLETSCGQVNESSAICLLDEENGCIRKYASKCHLDIEACKRGKRRTNEFDPDTAFGFVQHLDIEAYKRGKDYTDYSDVYCSMETYICEETPTFERWTIFFGHVKD